MNVARIQDHQRLKQILEANRSAGWATHSLNPAEAVHEPVRVYLFDDLTKTLRGGTFELDDIARMELEVGADLATKLFDQAIESIIEYVVARPADSDAELKLKKALVSAARYAVTTATFKAVQDPRGMNLLLMLYRSSHSEQAKNYLRPCLLPQQQGDSYLDVNVLFDEIGKRSAADRVEHPEWFREQGAILAFRKKASGV